MPKVMPYRILQIIPAPVGMRAAYALHEKQNRFFLPIINLALIEEEGDTFVRPMVAWNDGEVNFADDASNFSGFLYQNEDWSALEATDP